MNSYKVIDTGIKNPDVTIAMLAYNHEKYIAEAIESVLCQQTEYSYKIVIAEDCSTDSTREIILSYQKRFPDRIGIILQNSNVGAKQNNYDLLSYIDGKYIAALEGDDYWVDSNKLQKQIDILEHNSNISICATNTIVIYENGEDSHIFNSGKRMLIDKITHINIEDLISDLVPFHTSSVVFRNTLKLPTWFTEIVNGDFVLFFMCGLLGDIIAIPDITSCYRKHSKGITITTLIGSYNLMNYIKLYEYLNSESNYKYKDKFYYLLYKYKMNYAAALMWEEKYNLAIKNLIKVIKEYPLKSLADYNIIASVLLRSLFHASPRKQKI